MGNTPNDGNTQDVYSQNAFNYNNIKASINSIKQLNESLNKPLSESVFDLVNCFICLSPAIDPVSCPKCNNFACKNCFSKYFGNKNVINCPFCKQEISSYQLKKKDIIEEIENILNQNQNNQEKIEQLKKLSEEKKKFWDNQTNSVNKFLNRINEYKKTLEEYVHEEEKFFQNCLKVTTNILAEFNININKLKDSLLSYNKTFEESKDFDKFTKNNKYDKQIKELIREILYLERKHFNEKNKGELENILKDSKFCAPSLITFKLNNIKLDKYNSKDIKEKTVKLRNDDLGEYEFKFIQNPITKDVNCSFNFTPDYDKEMSAFVKLTKTDIKGYYKNYPIKFINKEGRKFCYQNTIPFDEFKEGISRSYIFTPLIRLYSILS